jgi:hypothetical protein
LDSAVQVRDEICTLARDILFVANPQKEGGVDGHEDRRVVAGRKNVAALRRQFHLRAEERVQCCRAECDNQIRPHQFDLGPEPPGATLDLPCIGFRMQATLAARLEFKMPGCSPTSMIAALSDPSPKTSWVAFL